MLFEHPRLGVVTFNANVRAKHISIKLSARNGIVVTFPSITDGGMEQARRFLDEKVEIIERKMTRITRNNPSIIFNEQTQFCTHFHQLVLIPSSTIKDNSLSTIIGTDEIRISHPRGIIWTETWVQNGIKKAIIETYRREAKKYLPSRVALLAEKHHFHYTKISIRNTNAQWGSCSHQNKLSFSLHLMGLDFHLIDLIIMHELCHTVHKNHSKDFHALLKQVVPQKEQWEKELKWKHCFL